MSIKESLEKCLDVLPETRFREMLDFAELLKRLEEKQQIDSNDDEAGAAWAKGVEKEWSAAISDPREDIYTLSDGEPLHGRG